MKLKSGYVIPLNTVVETETHAKRRALGRLQG
jgi:hypothetical protein